MIFLKFKIALWLYHFIAEPEYANLVHVLKIGWSSTSDVIES